MANHVHELRHKAGDTEKITINLGYIDLGQFDLMLQEGFYSNRTDFIRAAIRNQIERHGDAVKRSAAHRSLDLGLRHYSREDLEALDALAHHRTKAGHDPATGSPATTAHHARSPQVDLLGLAGIVA
jgi:Arc/MetJ-type ribon-helix-helix transcriptional regulator